MYVIRPAALTDVPALMRLRTDAEQWLRSIGSDQWLDEEVGQLAIARWRSFIDSGLSWVVESNDGETVGTVSRGPADRDFWHESDQPETAFYFYKLIVSRAAAGQRIGSMICDWAGRIATAEGRQWLRFDCWRTNKELQRYYEQLGFQHVRTEWLDHRRSGWLAQRPADLVLEQHQLVPSIKLCTV